MSQVNYYPSLLTLERSAPGSRSLKARHSRLYHLRYS